MLPETSLPPFLGLMGLIKSTDDDFAVLVLRLEPTSMCDIDVGHFGTEMSMRTPRPEAHLSQFMNDPRVTLVDLNPSVFEILANSRAGLRKGGRQGVRGNSFMFRLQAVAAAIPSIPSIVPNMRTRVHNHN